MAKRNVIASDETPAEQQFDADGISSQVDSTPGEAVPPEALSRQPPQRTWFYCRFNRPFKELHVLAGSVDEAKEKFKRAIGIRATVHPVHASEHQGYEPSSGDLELEKRLSETASR